MVSDISKCVIETCLRKELIAMGKKIDAVQNFLLKQKSPELIKDTQDYLTILYKNIASVKIALAEIMQSDGE